MSRFWNWLMIKLGRRGRWAKWCTQYTAVTPEELHAKMAKAIADLEWCPPLSGAADSMAEQYIQPRTTPVEWVDNLSDDDAGPIYGNPPRYEP